jgi:hypothetical protein
MGREEHSGPLLQISIYNEWIHVFTLPPPFPSPRSGNMAVAIGLTLSQIYLIVNLSRIDERLPTISKYDF